jgi:hypothetical protein
VDIAQHLDSKLLTKICENTTYTANLLSNAVKKHLMIRRTDKTTNKVSCLQEEPDEHGQGKWEGKQEGKSDKRFTTNKGGAINIFFELRKEISDNQQSRKGKPSELEPAVG